MSEDKNEGLYTATAPALLSFPNLMEAKAVMKNGKATGDPKFSSNFELDLDHPDLKPIKNLALKLALAKWPGRDIKGESSKVDKNGNPKIPTFLFPWSSGDDLANKAKKNGKEREWSRGKLVIVARSKFEPNLSAIINGAVVDFEGDNRKTANKYFFTGADVLFQINLQAYDGVGVNPDGVTAYLNKVLATGKGKKLTGGGQSATETFKGYIGTATNEDVTGGAEDDEF